MSVEIVHDDDGSVWMRGYMSIKLRPRSDAANVNGLPIDLDADVEDLERQVKEAFKAPSTAPGGRAS